MALLSTIGGNGTLFIGEDKTLYLELLQPQFDVNGALLSPGPTSVPVDMTGFAIVFDVRVLDTSTDPPIFLISAGLTGAYNAVRSVNTQRMQVVLTDDLLNTINATPKGYRYSWKRTDEALETILAWGPFMPQKATAD
jgi:hypothetical protein